MTEKVKSCVDCKNYIAPGWFAKNFTDNPFKERCGHPLAADEIDGLPRPCITVRLMICSNGSLFEGKVK